MACPKDVTMQDLSGRWTLNTKLSDNIDPMLALQGVSWLARTALSLTTVKLQIKHYHSDDASPGPAINTTTTATTPTQAGPAQPSSAKAGDTPAKDTAKEPTGVKGKGKTEQVEHIDIAQTMSGIPSSHEHRVLDWTLRKSSNAVFGEVEGRSRRIPTPKEITQSLTDGDAATRAWMAEGWSPAPAAAVDGGGGEEGFVQSYVRSLEKGRGLYQIEQVWGIGDVGGERRHVRRLRTWTEDGKGGVKKEQRTVLVYDWRGREGEEERNAWDDTV